MFIFDEERCDEAFADPPNVFETEQLVLTSLEFLQENAGLSKQLWLIGIY